MYVCVYAHDLDTFKYQKLHFLYCVVECVGVLFSADLCQFPPTDGLPGSAHKQPLNGRIVAGAEVQTVGLLPPKHVDCLLWAGSPLPVNPPHHTHTRTHTQPHCHCQAGGRKSNQLRLYLKKIGAGPEKWGHFQKTQKQNCRATFLAKYRLSVEQNGTSQKTRGEISHLTQPMHNKSFFF